MKKLDMHSPDLVQKNIDRIAELFPNCLTEAADEKGRLVRRIDFDLLRQELEGILVEGPAERFRLDWPGKRQALLTANAPIAKTLRPDRASSVNFDTTRNIYIEGDNLDALKLLQENYLGKVKMIYIDPPYNTGHDFIYEDDFAEDSGEYLLRSNQKDEEGNRLTANTEANGRFHSDWLSMMYSRLKLARNLLRDDGVIFISIDDGEFADLRKIGDEVFGEDNFIGNIIWKKKTNGNNMGFIPPVHDYFVVYQRGGLKEEKFGFELGDEYIKRTYSNPDNDPRGDWTTSDLSANHVGPYFKIVNPKTGQEFYPPQGRYWVFNETDALIRIADGRIIFGKSGNSAPVQKKFLSERSLKRLKVESWWDKHGLNEDGSQEQTSLFGRAKLFSHPKPTQTIKHLCEISTSKNSDDLILDFFSGSATTAHAAMQLNAEDGGNRRFIMVQLPEEVDDQSEAFKAGYKTIADIGRERIRRAGQNILQKMSSGEGFGDGSGFGMGSGSGAGFGDGSGGDGHPLLDIGFRSFKIDSSNMTDVYYTPDDTSQGKLAELVDNIKPDRTDEDLLFQVMLDWGLDLSLPLLRKTIAGAEVFEVDGNALAACFADKVNEQLVTELAKRQPPFLRVVFRDSSFQSDSDRINVEQIFKQLSPSTEVKVI